MLRLFPDVQRRWNTLKAVTTLALRTDRLSPAFPSFTCPSSALPCHSAAQRRNLLFACGNETLRESRCPPPSLLIASNAASLPSPSLATQLPLPSLATHLPLPSLATHLPLSFRSAAEESAVCLEQRGTPGKADASPSAGAIDGSGHRSPQNRHEWKSPGGQNPRYPAHVSPARSCCPAHTARQTAP